jgi:hypothetical protein
MPEIHLSFEKMGATVQPVAGKLFLDTGNNLCQGIIDHHQLSYETCTAQLVIQKPELCTDWLAGFPVVEIVLHLKPDIDCIASLYIVDAVLNAKPVIRENMEKLTRYTMEMDMGRTEPPDIHRPSLYDLLTARLQLIRDEFSCEEGKTPDEQLSDERCSKMSERMAEEGLVIIAKFMELLEHGEIEEFRLNKESSLKHFPVERKYLDDDYQWYCSDLGDFNRVTIIQPRIPLHGLNTSEVKKALIYRNPSSSLFKLWARHDAFHAGTEEGFTVLLVIWNSVPGGSKRYIMSTDPEGKYCLRFLGDVLNYHEAHKREVLGKRQEGQNRPGYDLPDPWYDGRAHDYTIVDTPHDGTVLDEEEVISIFTHFITEHIFLETIVHENRVHVVFPLRLPSGMSADLVKLEETGFEPVPIDRSFIQTFTTSFISLFFSNRFNIKLFVKPLGERKELKINTGELEERFNVLIESCRLLFYSNMMLYSVQMRIEDPRLRAVQEISRFLYSPDLVQDPQETWSGGFLLGQLNSLGLKGKYFISKPFIHTDLLLENFHFFREPELVTPIMNAILSGEKTSIPSRSHGNAVIKWSDYYAVGMNFTHYLSFQNLSDPQLSRKNILDIFALDKVHAFYLYMFVILKKVVLRDLSERFSGLDLLRIKKKSSGESRKLEEDVLNYINTINIRHITNDRLAGEVFMKLHEVNAISESFDEIFTSIQQLNAYNDSLIQKRQSYQMDLLQAIFLIGVAASVITLGAMPGAHIRTYDIFNHNLISRSEFEAFGWIDFLKFAPLVVAVGIGLYFLVRWIVSKLLER